ncbi:proteoglycan 4-like [Oryza brachyantha]|uniref:glutathione transferase n=1 Tax=Oryza brachyantha TaxID=4533 RepID=J3MV38_ORYBR|nr:proteoglycan 4-like [Oryza brachyantha]
MAGLSTGAGAPVVKLYHEKSMILPDVSRVLACLYEKDIQAETVKASYKDILRLQASRSVPVPFYDGPTFLQESRAICRYIAETYEQRGYPFLLGKDVLERASIEQWLRHEEHAFDPPSRALFCHLAFPVHEDDDDDINKEKRKLEEVLEVYEQRLGESEFLAGNKFTLADLVHLPNTHHIVTSEFAYLYDSRKNVQRWWNTISTRDSWQQVLRDMNSVEEQYQMELEQQEEQWQTQYPQTSVAHTIHLDPRKTTGTESRTVLVPPPSARTISTSSSSQGEQPPPSETTYHDKLSPRKERNFFTNTEETSSTPRSKTSTTQKMPSSTFSTTATPPTTTKTSQSTYTDMSSSKYSSSQTKPSQISSREAPSKSHAADYFRASTHTNEPASLTKSSPREASKTSSKTPDLGTSPRNKEAETSTDPRGSVQPPYVQEHAEQVKKPSADQRADARLLERVASKDVKGEIALPAQPRGIQEVTKDARQADQKRVIAAPPQQQSSDEQNVHKQFTTPPTLEVPDLSTTQPESTEDAHNITSEDDRFATRRLRKMIEESDKAAQAAKSQPTDFQPSKEEETPYSSKKPSDVQDRTIPNDRKTSGSPSTGTRAPNYPTSAAERRVASPPKGGVPHYDLGATRPQKSPYINEQEKTPVVPSQAQPTSLGQASESSKEVSPDDGLDQLSTINQWRQASTPPTKQAAPVAPRNDELVKTTGIDKRTPISTTKQMPRDDRNALAIGQGAARGIANGQSDKNSIMDERAPQITRQAAPSGTQRASASIQEGNNGARGTSDDMFGKTSSPDQSNTPAISKQTTVQQAIPDVRGTRDDDRDMKLPVDEKATTNKQMPISSSQQTIEPIKGTTPTSYDINGDELPRASRTDERPTPSSRVQAPVSDRQDASTALQGGIPDAPRENTLVKPTGMPTSPRRQESTPDTQGRRTADQVPPQASLLSSFTGTRNKENVISEAGQNNKIVPSELPGGRVPKDAEPNAAGPSLMKSQKNMNEAYNIGPSTQQLPNDRYRPQPAEAKQKQGADAAVINEIGKLKKDDMMANPNQSSTGKVQLVSTEETSKLQLQSGQNKPISSKDSKETESYGSSAMSREMLPFVPNKSMRAQQMQGDKSSISQENNVQQGSEATLEGSRTEQPKKRDLLANAGEKIGGTPGEALQMSEEQTSSDVERMKSNRNNSKPDGSTKSASFDGNEGNPPESQRRGSSSNP